MTSKFPVIEGFTSNGDYVQTITITGTDGFRASVITLGARLVDLCTADGVPLTVSLSSLKEVEEDCAYIGAVIGRTANRIRGGTFPLGGQILKLEKNFESEGNHAHGGRRAWDKRLFAVTEKGVNYVEMFLFSPHGDQGYPSSVEVRVRYEMKEKGELAISLKTTNVGFEDTVTNMTIHPYFDLTGLKGSKVGSAFEHTMYSPNCLNYLMLGSNNVPTGEIKSVEGTTLDFRQDRKIGAASPSADFDGFDNYFVFEHTPAPRKLRELVRIDSPPLHDGSKLRLEVFSNMPGFQFYTANGFPDSPNAPAQKFGSFAIEPSEFIDAANNDFPPISLAPGQSRDQLITYKFTSLPAS